MMASGSGRAAALDAAHHPPAVAAGSDSADERECLAAALRGGKDLRGPALLAQPDGPTYQGTVDQLTPIFCVDRQYQTVGHHDLAETYAREAADFADGLRQAVQRSARRLEDGSLFVPVALLTDESPRSFLLVSRRGSYWILVSPWASAAALLPVAQTRHVLDYADHHGGFFLGLTRFGGLYEPVPPIGECHPGCSAGFRSTGVDNAWGVQVLRVFADLAEADRVVLALYAKLALGCTRGTYVDGEGTTLCAGPGEDFRSTWYPPNSTSNAYFLDLLRLALVRETHDQSGRPDGLDLAWATPRSWLADGQEIVVQDLPTEFGPISYTVRSNLARNTITATIRAPTRRTPRRLTLSLRLPAGHRPDQVEGAGAARIVGDVIGLTVASGPVTLTAHTTPVNREPRHSPTPLEREPA